MLHRSAAGLSACERASTASLISEAAAVATAEDVRQLCLALPEVHAQPHHHVTMFFVRRRHFANTRSILNSHLADMERDQPLAVVKLDREDQLALIDANPGVLLPHRYHARHGWAVLLLEHTDMALLGMLLRLAWANVAPKRLLKTANSGRCSPSVIGAPKL